MDPSNLDDIFKQLEAINKYDTVLTEKCICLSEAIHAKKITIHNVVEKLGSLLTNQSPEKREMGTLVLSQILENLPNSFLSSTELHFISSFYSDRLKDNHQVIPAVVRGLLALVQMENLPEGAPHKLLNALFENVPCQQQQMKDRQSIYQIFKEILNRRTTEINAMGIDFVLGVIQSMDGERDPRNLLLLFNWLPVFLHSVKLGHLIEEMFDVIACYFPVDFRTPAQDAQTVTREDLADALCPCLCAVPEFAEFSLPLIIDKLNSSLKIAKYDSLNLLIESCKTFNVSIYEQHSHDIWSLLQKETLNSSDSDIEEAGLNAISAVINKLSQSENDSFFKQTVGNLYDTLKGNLRPDTKLFISSSKILLAVARASKESCNDLVQPIVALLLNQINLTKDSNQKEILFRTLMEFVVAYVKLFEITNIAEVKVLEEIPSLCLQSLNSPQTKIRVIAFESLSRIAKMLPPAFKIKVFEMLKLEIIVEEPENVRNSILKCFKTFATLYKTEILDHVLSSEIDSNNLIVLNLYLEALSTIVSDISFAEIIIPKILNHSTNNNLPVAKISMTRLRKLIEENCDNKSLQEYLFNDCKTIDQLTRWILSIIDQTDYELLEDVSTIVKIIVGFQDAEKQRSIVEIYINELLNCYKNNIQAQDKIIIVLEGFLIRLRPEVEIPEKFQLIRELLQVSNCIQENIYLYACMIIANIINKCTEDDNFINILNEIETFVSTTLENNNNKLNLKNAIQLISWITKSLIIKGSDRSNLWTDKLISLLDKFEETGKSFRLIMDESYDCLSTKSYCTNRLLYRQKFFAYVCKKLSSNYNETKPNYLLALGYLLQLAPLQVIILYFKETLRLLIFCLELCKDSDVLCAVLNTLSVLIQAKEPYLENHIDDLLPRFLNLTTFDTNLRVRMAALKCIEDFPSGYPVYKLLPHKQNIIFGLEKSLDDRKRLVRRQAVEARSHWFLLDAPT